MLDKTSSIICAFGLAAAAPRSPYRHLELCGIALGVLKPGQGKCLRTFKAVPCETLYRLRKTIKPAVVLQLLTPHSYLLTVSGVLQ
ncbi:MAG: hypothetical protein ACLT8A_12100 [Subdoligranulum sp.]